MLHKKSLCIRQIHLNYVSHNKFSNSVLSMTNVENSTKNVLILNSFWHIRHFKYLNNKLSCPDTICRRKFYLFFHRNRKPSTNCLTIKLPAPINNFFSIKIWPICHTTPFACHPTHLIFPQDQTNWQIIHYFFPLKDFKRQRNVWKYHFSKFPNLLNFHTSTLTKGSRLTLRPCFLNQWHPANA